MQPARRRKRPVCSWVSFALAALAAAMVLIVFTHPRCFSDAGLNDNVPYYLFGLWCVAEFLAACALLSGLLGVVITTGRVWSSWLDVLLSLMVMVGGIAYPVVVVLARVVEGLSQNGFHGIGK